MNIKETVKTLSKKATFNVKKYSPEILTGGAIVFGLATVVLTWIAARKTDEALAEPKQIIKEAKETELSETYSKKDQTHALTIGYLKGGMAITKLYGPAVLMGSFSIACILGSYKILSRRNAGLIAVNSILQKEFSDYRDKVIEKYGKEEDYKLRIGDKSEQTTETTTDENGKEVTSTVTKPKKEDYGSHDFGRWFDESCVEWQKDTQYNLRTLKRLEHDFSSRLQRDHVLTMNEVYDELGLERTKAGFEWGWVCQKGTEPQTFVSFGIPWEDDEWIDEMVHNNERYFFMDFNCSKIIFAETPYREV